MSLDLKKLTIASVHTHLLDGDFSAVELAEAYCAEIEKRNKDLNAYLEVFDDVREQAQEADKRIKAGKAGLLTGIPLAIKDNILIEGRRVGAASKILEGYVAPYDATAIKKLKEAGAVFLGRTNCDEFAMGGSTENSAYGVTKNPADTARVAGGSSGGSAAAVAADMALAALGSDTGGSVREPASFCGVVGFKPSYGAVSRYGLIAMGSSLDCIGPIAKSAEDAEIIFNCIKGRDSMDSTSRDFPTSKLLNFSPSKLIIGVPRDLIGEGVDADVLANFNEALERLRSAGVEIVDVALPDARYALPCYYIIMPAEASTNLARYDGVKYGVHRDGGNLLGDYLTTRAHGFGSEVRRRILIGTYVLSSGYYDAYYNKAVAVRQRIQAAFSETFRHVDPVRSREGSQRPSASNGVDVIATPTAPTPAWKVGEKGDPLSMYLADIFTVTANIAGIPAISLPSGKTQSGLPLGIQFMAAHGREDTLFAAGRLFEEARGE